MLRAQGHWDSSLLKAVFSRILSSSLTIPAVFRSIDPLIVNNMHAHRRFLSPENDYSLRIDTPTQTLHAVQSSPEPTEASSESNIIFTIPLTVARFEAPSTSTSMASAAFWSHVNTVSFEILSTDRTAQSAVTITDTEVVTVTELPTPDPSLISTARPATPVPLPVSPMLSHNPSLVASTSQHVSSPSSSPYPSASYSLGPASIAGIVLGTIFAGLSLALAVLYCSYVRVRRKKRGHVDRGLGA
ncbi:hypothetical protein EK21DRAFT_94744 [Setomelanomma holmii]|uniref:Uncharacterized protein n=1 Tax=Setomelanomma holmii TaxID=210430 RepID=A0A9P4GY38_9PLEO|nr:hypothetical protein EK21DRAFT_94744 [Setomelanomma holmii]